MLKGKHWNSKSIPQSSITAKVCQEDVSLEGHICQRHSMTNCWRKMSCLPRCLLASYYYAGYDRAAVTLRIKNMALRCVCARAVCRCLRKFTNWSCFTGSPQEGGKAKEGSITSRSHLSGLSYVCSETRKPSAKRCSCFDVDLIFPCVLVCKIWGLVNLLQFLAGQHANRKSENQSSPRALKSPKLESITTPGTLQSEKKSILIPKTF